MKVQVAWADRGDVPEAQGGRGPRAGASAPSRFAPKEQRELLDRVRGAHR